MKSGISSIQENGTGNLFKNLCLDVLKKTAFHQNKNRRVHAAGSAGANDGRNILLPTGIVPFQEKTNRRRWHWWSLPPKMLLLCQNMARGMGGQTGGRPSLHSQFQVPVSSDCDDAFGE
jgi:hypothetical protein